ncbi:hypothetical protein BCV72DRAFT_201515, partial [Rhizopus microsporus var. microsporus]
TVLLSKRESHKVQPSTYWLPKDEEEQQRLVGQHLAFKELFEVHILSYAFATNTLDLKRGVSIVNAGCGSGAWVTVYVNSFLLFQKNSSSFS